MLTEFQEFYEAIVLRRPVATLVSIGLLTASVGWFAQDFALDVPLVNSRAVDLNRISSSIE